jgi:hypothetical protein
MHGLLQHSKDTRRPRANCGRRGEHDDAAERKQEEKLRHGAVLAREEDRDDDDRPELSGNACAEHGRTESCRQQAGIAEDRDEGAERGRSHGDTEHPPLGVKPCLLQYDANQEPDRDRDRPSRCPAHERLSRYVLLDHFEACEEEQECEAEVGEEVDVRVDLSDAEHLGTEDDPQHDLDDYGGEDDPVVQPRQDGAQT